MDWVVGRLVFVCDAISLEYRVDAVTSEDSHRYAALLSNDMYTVMQWRV